MSTSLRTSALVGVSVVAIIAIVVGTASLWRAQSSGSVDRQQGNNEPGLIVRSMSAASTDGTAAGGAADSTLPPLPRRVGALAVNDFAHRYETATDAKALFDELIASDAVEAPYFAGKILRHCAVVARLGFDEMMAKYATQYPGAAETLPARRDAYRRLYEPCKGFQSRRNMLEEMAALRLEGGRRGDPRALAQTLQLQLIGMTPPVQLNSEQVQLAARLLESYDPYVLHELGLFIHRAATASGSIAGFSVSDANKSALSHAWLMTRCSYGFNCGPDSDWVLASCAFNGYCGAASVEDLLRSAAWARDQYAIALEMHSKILDALRHKDYAALGIVIAKPAAPDPR